MSYALRGLLAGLFLSVAAASAHAAPVNLLLNGSFEGFDFAPGSFIGWSPSGPGWFTATSSGFGPSGGAEDGNFYAGNGQRPETVSLSQAFNDTPGATLTFSGYFAAQQNINNLQVSFDDDVLLTKTLYNTGGAWEFFTFNVTAGGSGLDHITIQFQSDRLLGLDNFIVSEAVVQTPLPATLPLFASGLAGLIGIARRSKKRSS